MTPAAPEDLGFDPQRLNRITNWMQSYVDARKFAGCSVLIARQGREVFFSSVGARNVEKDLPFERDTVVRIYSMTKPIASTMLMILAERGLFHLEAPVSDFIKEFNEMQALIPAASALDQTEPCTTPTLHQLLTHTSGLSYAFNPGLLGQLMAERGIGFAPDRVGLAAECARLAELPLAFQPGARWNYSTGIDVIGRVIEVVTGQSLDQALREHIFEPLGMSTTGFTVPQGVGDQFASLYTPLDGDSFALGASPTGGDTLRCVDTYHDSPFHNTTCLSGGGGLVGTIDDYMAFAELLRQGGTLNGERLLSPKTVSFMQRNHLPGDIASLGPDSFAEMPMDGMGFGIGGAVVIDPARARTPGSVGDYGWGGMASTYYWSDPVHALSVVFFTQLSPSSSYPNRAQLKALVHGALLT